MNIRKSILSIAFFMSAAITLTAAEGMWIPLFLKKLNEAEMKSLGMKIDAEDIYSVNRSSLKDAVVLWAKNKSEELINPSLSVTFIKRIEEVTDAALTGVTDDMDLKSRNEKIAQNIRAIRDTARREEWQNVEIKPFFKDNRYFMFIRETYSDVRLVGCPPVSVGKYGSETDNWVWPRHTGDFSVFRIYADKNNRPAAPSADNVPYRPDHFFPISLNGVKEGDFTLVFGFPGRTDEYLPAPALEQTANHRNPVR